MQDKQIVIVAGPNGAGKTTFVEAFLPELFDIPLFVNADNIAGGLAPFSPESEAVQAGRLMLKQIGKYVSEGVSFSFETTLAGRGYAVKIPGWRRLGYSVCLIFLSLRDERVARERVAYRVSQGGHGIPADVIRRRFHSGLRNFHALYKNIVDSWFLYDNMARTPRLIEAGGK